MTSEDPVSAAAVAVSVQDVTKEWASGGHDVTSRLPWGETF